jgi:hypothetical protein
VACAEKDRRAVNQGETPHLFLPLPFELGVAERWWANNDSEAITTEPCYIGNELCHMSVSTLTPVQPNGRTLLGGSTLRANL